MKPKAPALRRRNPRRSFSVPLLFCGSLLFTIASAFAAAPAPLADALEKKDLATARALLRDTNVNAAQSDGTTALHWAVRNDDLATATALLAAGANAKTANRFGVTPLSLACVNGNAALITLLLDAGADANAPLRGGETPLMTAARTGQLDAVQALLARGVDVNAKLPTGGQTA
ncbi:MAG: ankyrin repeat domain-containing protein, partial [Opitutaceae bacterium]